MREVVGCHGILAPPGNASALAEGLHAAAALDRTACRAYALRHLSVAAMIAGYESCYTDAVAKVGIELPNDAAAASASSTSNTAAAAGIGLVRLLARKRQIAFMRIAQLAPPAVFTANQAHQREGSQPVLHRLLAPLGIEPFCIGDHAVDVMHRWHVMGVVLMIPPSAPHPPQMDATCGQ